MVQGMSILLVFVIPIVIAIFPMVMDWLERAVVFPDLIEPLDVNLSTVPAGAVPQVSETQG